MAASFRSRAFSSARIIRLPADASALDDAGATSTRLGVVRGAMSLGSARILINLLNTASILILARLLTPDDFGVIAIATTVLSVAMSFTEMSFQPALVQHPEATVEHVDTVWTMLLIRSAVLVMLFALVAWPLSRVYAEPRLIPVFVVSGASGAFMGLYNPRIAQVMRDMRFGPYTIFQISQKCVSLAFAVAFALAYRSYWSIIIGNALGAFAASFLSYFLIPYRPRFTLVHVGEIWGFSGWMFLNQICETLNWRLDQLAIGLMEPRTGLGNYAIADNLAVIPSREVSVPLRSALFAGLATLNDNPDRLRGSYLRAQAAIAMVTTPAALGLALVAAPAVQVVLGPKWMTCVPYVRVLAIAYAFDSINTLMQPLAMAMGRTKFLFIRQILSLVVRLPLILFGLFMGGITGAAIGRAISEVLGFFISLLLSRRLLDLPLGQQLRSHGMTVAGLMAMGAMVLIVRGQIHHALVDRPLLRLAILGGVGATSYCGSILLLWMARGRPQGAVSEILSILGRFAFRRGGSSPRLSEVRP